MGDGLKHSPVEEEVSALLVFRTCVHLLCPQVTPVYCKEECLTNINHSPRYSVLGVHGRGFKYVSDYVDFKWDS